MVPMVSQAQVGSYRSLLSAVETAALNDVYELLVESAGWPVEARRDLLFEAFPEVLDPYAVGVSEISAQFYEELREAAGVRATSSVVALDEGLPDRSVKSLLGFASHETLGVAPVFQVLAGGVTRRLSELAADTIISNAQNDSVVVGYQRVPQAGCCAFCGMLASRGAAYSSREAAGTVVGRGRPVGSSRRAGGVRARGSQGLGEKFHDHCRCAVVPVFENTAVEMQSKADEYLDAYRESYEKARDGLVWEPKRVATEDQAGHAGRWVRDGAAVSSASTQATILSFMRDTLGVK